MFLTVLKGTMRWKLQYSEFGHNEHDLLLKNRWNNPMGFEEFDENSIKKFNFGNLDGKCSCHISSQCYSKTDCIFLFNSFQWLWNKISSISLPQLQFRKYTNKWIFFINFLFHFQYVVCKYHKHYTTAITRTYKIE